MRKVNEIYWRLYYGWIFWYEVRIFNRRFVWVSIMNVYILRYGVLFFRYWFRVVGYEWFWISLGNLEVWFVWFYYFYYNICGVKLYDFYV